HAADHQVVEGADAVEDPRHLEHAQHAKARELGRVQAEDAAAVELHFAGIGQHVPGEHVEQGGLARAVGTDQADQFALGDIHADAIDRPQAAEALLDAADFEQRHQASFAVPARRRMKAWRARPQSPSRKKRAKMITSAANTIIWMLPTSRSISEAT